MRTMTVEQELALERVKQQQRVVEAWEDAHARTCGLVTAAIRAADLVAGRAAKARLRRAEDQLWVAEQDLTRLRGEWDAVRPRGASYGRTG